jgi:hypothetical protein
LVSVGSITFYTITDISVHLQTYQVFGAVVGDLSAIS